MGLVRVRTELGGRWLIYPWKSCQSQQCGLKLSKVTNLLLVFLQINPLCAMAYAAHRASSCSKVVKKERKKVK